MPIHPPDTPEIGVRTVQETLRELLAIPGFVREIVRDVTLGLPAVTTPHLVYGVSLEDLATGQGLEAAVPRRLRFLILSDQSVLGGVEIALDDVGNPGNVTNLFRGPSIEEFTRIIEGVERRDVVREGSFELRLLSIPPLHTLAVWLKDDAEAEDILIPISPAPAPLRAGEPHSSPELLRALAEPAQRLLALAEQVTT